MYGLSDLKSEIRVEGEEVSCPIAGCAEMVVRQRGTFRRCEVFKCPVHGIYISPTTFDYETEKENLLWADEDDLNLLRQIKGSKRESRISRDNSEDAVTWNVFRFLEKNGLVSKVLSPLLGTNLVDPKLVYWSHCQEGAKLWSGLAEARKAFGEPVRTGSEPDLIIHSKNALVFLEAKLTSGNKTRPNRADKVDKYESGGDNWSKRVCRSTCREIAIDNKKYELMRFWLLGTWLANEQRIPFYMVSLVRAGKEEDIEDIFHRLFKTNDERLFIRLTWEDFNMQIEANQEANPEAAQKLLKYFREKTIGYGSDRKIRPAFAVL